MERERRSEPRVRAINLVNVAEFTEAGLNTELTIGRTLDLSHEGMRVELNHAPPLRAVIALELALGETVLALQARVRSVTEVDDATCAVGLQFVDVTPEQWEDLDAHLQLRG